MRKFLLLLFLVGCNYNYHLGKKLEAQGKFEEASVEYSRAYLKNYSNKKYQTAYQRNAIKTVEILKKTYQKQLFNQNFFSAYKILEKGLLLVENDKFFLAEQKKWSYILLVGKIQYPRGKNLQKLTIGEKIYPIVQFISPNSKKNIEITLEIDGSFFLEDLLYLPSDMAYLSYAINSIGFKYLPLQTQTQSAISEDDFTYLNIINFYQPELQAHLGTFNNHTFVQLEKPTSNINYWYPKRGISYTSKVQGQKIFIESSSPQNSFLPTVLYKKDQRVVLDFGLISLQKKTKSFLWGVTQNHSSELKKKIKENYYYRVYEKTLTNPYLFTNQNALQSKKN